MFMSQQAAIPSVYRAVYNNELRPGLCDARHQLYSAVNTGNTSHDSSCAGTQKV